MIDENTIKEQDVRNTLGKLDPNSDLDVDEMAGKLNELSQEASAKAQPKTETSTSKRIIDAAKSGIGALQKSNEPEEPPKNTNTENDYLKALGREENVFKLCDDFN